MNRRTLPLLLPLVAIVLVGCGDTLSVKYGSAGEACEADNDCRDDLLCYRSHCVDPTAANNGANNGTSNGYDLTCAGVCEYIGDCNIDELNCVSDCSSETAGWTNAGKEAVFECLLDLSCDRLGQPAFYDACKELRNDAP